MVPKNDGTNPIDFRPIAVTSVVYRLWSATRLQDLMAWQEGWATPEQHGARANHGTEDVFWSLALKIEHAHLHGLPLYGFELDYAKCFDSLPLSILFKLASHMGMHPRIHAALSGYYGGLSQRFRMGKSVGKEFCTTNGILQGCPLSIILLNALVSVWCRAVKEETPQVAVHAFVDDTGAEADKPRLLNKALAVTAEYASLTGQSINTTKSKGFTTVTARMHRLKYNDGHLDQTNETKTVGGSALVHDAWYGRCRQFSSRCCQRMRQNNQVDVCTLRHTCQIGSRNGPTHGVVWVACHRLS